MVIRDLTLRSAASFGSFHLIRLLYDEYMFYLVEHRVAMATGETSIAVMGEFLNLTQRSKEDDDAGSTSVPPSPSGSSGSLHVGVTASLSPQKTSNNSGHHMQQQMADGSSNTKRPKLSWFPYLVNKWPACSTRETFKNQQKHPLFLKYHLSNFLRVPLYPFLVCRVAFHTRPPSFCCLFLNNFFFQLIIQTLETLSRVNILDQKKEKKRKKSNKKK